MTEAARRRRLWTWATATAAAAATLAAEPAVAEPYLAMRTGYQCAVCHVNLTGGGKRNAYGVDYGLEKLPSYRLPVPEGGQPARGVVTDFLSIGADFRGLNASRFTSTGDTNAFATQEADLYADLSLVRDRIRLYADVRTAPGGAQGREVMALLENLPGHFYVKVGRFFPPFGWRLLDDGAFIRARTGFTFQSPDDGVEVGWQPGRLASSLAITNGNGGGAEDNTNKRVSMISSWAGPRFRAGASFSANHQADTSTLLAGLLGGVKMGRRLVVLGELDGGRDEAGPGGPTTRRLLGFLEGDLLVGKGWNLKAACDYEDPDSSQGGDEVNRITLGAEWFATQYVQIRFLWRRTDRPPEVHGVMFQDDREALLELHLFL